MRCNKNGGSCANISGATNKNALRAHECRRRQHDPFQGAGEERRRQHLRVVGADSRDHGGDEARRRATGCPTGTGTVQVANVSSPARLLIDQQQTSPSVVNRGTKQLIVRYHVSACDGRSVQGALVYATAVPFNQLSIPPEQTTGSDGWAELDFRMLAGFPVSSKQQLIAIFSPRTQVR